MNARQSLSIILGVMGGFLAFLPSPGKYSLHGSSQQLVKQSFDEKSSFTADQVARLIAVSDSSVQLIDLRSPSEYREFNIPGSVNLPYRDFLVKDAEPYLDAPEKKIIFYSNGDLYSGYALVLAKGLGFNNCFVMQGGMNAWFESVMNSRFTGGRISAHDNALFENRRKARELCVKVNSMPDSLKTAYISAQKFDPKKLDGGCE